MASACSWGRPQVWTVLAAAGVVGAGSRCHRELAEQQDSLQREAVLAGALLRTLLPPLGVRSHQHPTASQRPVGRGWSCVGVWPGPRAVLGAHEPWRRGFRGPRSALCPLLLRGAGREKWARGARSGRGREKWVWAREVGAGQGREHQERLVPRKGVPGGLHVAAPLLGMFQGHEGPGVRPQVEAWPLCFCTFPPRPVWLSRRPVRQRLLHQEG